jgi:hypothetical protein
MGFLSVFTKYFGLFSSLLYMTFGFGLISGWLPNTLQPELVVSIIFWTAYFYLVVQGLQIINMKLRKVSGGLMDVIFSFFPLIPFILGIVSYGSEYYTLNHLFMYVSVVVLDIVIFSYFILKNFQLTTDHTPVS